VSGEDLRALKAFSGMHQFSIPWFLATTV